MASAKAPSQVATCAAETLMGTPTLRNDGDHYWVIRNNGYGMPAVRWDFKPDGSGGTVIERRSTVYVSKGDDKIRACL